MTLYSNLFFVDGKASPLPVLEKGKDEGKKSSSPRFWGGIPLGGSVPGPGTYKVDIFNRGKLYCRDLFG